MEGRGGALVSRLVDVRSKVAMDACTLSPYPHLSWFAHGLIIRPPQSFVLHEYTAVAHRLIVTEDGDADLSWAAGETTANYRVTSGSLSLFPCDSAVHTLGITAMGGYRGHVVLMPNDHLVGAAAAAGALHTVAPCFLPVFRDTILLASILRLLVDDVRGRVTEDAGSEVAARHVIERLEALAGGRPPLWLRDTSVFAPAVMTRIVEYVDARLHSRPSLDEMSNGFGLSPAHFARKFKHSTGLSLNRFTNRRRVMRALALLSADEEPIAQLSLTLGFCSQSHFTRCFSGLTGLTPHQFRRSRR